MRSNISKEIKKVERELSGSEEYIKNLQSTKLKILLHHAVTNSAYYKEFVKVLSNESPYELIKRFPILEKSTVRDQYNDIITDHSAKLYAQKSSGSSGFQTQVFWSYDEFSSYRATGLVWWKWAKYEIGDWFLQTGINTKRGLLKYLKDCFFLTYYLQAFGHKEKDLDKALNWLSKKRLPAIGGYASSLYILACRAEERGMKLNIKTCISWGDKLFDHYRLKIENIFNAKVYQNYGSSEGFLMAAQKDLDYMYIMSNNVYMEILDDVGNEVPDGEMGHVVVTSLNNFAMPMIRYRIGDLAIKLPREKYPKHRELNLPILQKVIGRDTDIVMTPKGDKLVVHSFTGVFEHYQDIKQYQIIQNDLSGIIVKYIRDNEKSFSIQEIKSKILAVIGDADFGVDMQEVESIAPSPSGKPQIIISNLQKNKDF